MIIPTTGICCDAAHSMKNGVTEYQAIDLETGSILFYKNIGNQTTNIGEFLGLIESIKWVIKNCSKKQTIYCDSQTAISWFEGKYTSSNKHNDDLFKAVVFLQAMDSRIKELVEVKKWDTIIWGENPADFGNK